MMERILVLKLGALGNVVLSLGAFAAIRQHHRGAEITLLTTAPYVDWLSQSPYFDRVWTDRRPEWWDVPGWWQLRRRFADAGFHRVYDLQTSSRSGSYFRLFPNAARPEWSGIAPGCSHPDRDPDRDRLHDADRQAGQLRQAGILEIPSPDLSWSYANVARFGLPERYALLVPGSSAHRPGKRWPLARYQELARNLAAQDITSVVLGSSEEQVLGREMAGIAIDLTGRTRLGDLAPLASGALAAIGNDTGPMHLAAAAGCPSLVLFSHESDPALCAPRGRSVRILRRVLLADLPVSDVMGEVPRLLPLASTAG